MPQVRDEKIKDGWYKNVAKDADGKFVALKLGTVPFAPEKQRFVKAEVILASRFTYREFEMAKAEGKLLGPEESPFDEKKDTPVVKEPVTEKIQAEEPVVVEEPVVEEKSRAEELSDAKTKRELQAMAEELELDTGGNKLELAQRILDHEG